MNQKLNIFYMLLCLTALTDWAYGRSPKRPIESPTPTTEPTPSPVFTPVPFPPVFVTMGKDIGPSVDVKFAQEALDHLNRVVTTDCFKNDTLSDFKSTTNVFGTVLTPKAAVERYTSGAPYDLDLRWYYKRFGSVVGYTYNWKDSIESLGSEIRIWSNTRMMGDAKDYASHLAHELSHQARAGGFVHYTVRQGSFPYEIGDLVERCLE